MNGSDMKNFVMVLVGIGEIYGKEISETLNDIYWTVLEKYDWEDVNNAFSSHIRNPDVGQFFPRPSDIVRVIEGSGETKALLAWTKVEMAVRKIGSYKSVVFDDPLIHAVMRDMGGWIQLCSTLNKDFPFKENEFKKRYMGFLNKPPQDYPTRCIGIFEGDNLMFNYRVDAPILIGDQGKAKNVMLTGGGEKGLFKIGDFLENLTEGKRS